MSFLSRARVTSTSITEVSEAGMEVINSEITAECNELYSLLEEWGHPNDLPSRVQAGNSVYKNGLQVRTVSQLTLFIHHISRSDCPTEGGSPRTCERPDDTTEREGYP
jgi:hypothetical protein